VQYDLNKRLFDLILSIILLVITLPLTIAISLIIFLETGSNPFFIQQRGLTLNRGRFRIIKFRTFKTSHVQISSQGSSLLLKRSEENFVTFFGRILRKTGLDEMPQLINIIKGEMSFIGPRPLALNDLRMIEKNFPGIYAEREELNIKPGLSGLWQLNKGEDYSLKNLVELDKKYFLNRSFIFDLKLLLKSFKVVLLARHTDAVIERIMVKKEFKTVLISRISYLAGLLLLVRFYITKF
jgi:exopolysaccharide production protein ExoY